jgi:hypothetical protein
MNGYKMHFNQAQLFFKDRLEHAIIQSTALINRLAMD